MSNTAKINQELFLFVFKYIKKLLISAFLKCELFLLFLITFDSKLEIITFSDFFKKKIKKLLFSVLRHFTHIFTSWEHDKQMDYYFKLL